METPQYADDEFTDAADIPTRRQLKRWTQSRRKHNVITTQSNDDFKCKREATFNDSMVNRRPLYLPSGQQRIINGHRFKASTHKRRAPQPQNNCREWCLAIAMITLPVILMLVGCSQFIQEESITNNLYESSSILTTATLTSSIKQLHSASKGRSSTTTCIVALIIILPMFISGAQCALHGFIWHDWVPDDDAMGLALGTSTLASLSALLIEAYNRWMNVWS